MAMPKLDMFDAVEDLQAVGFSSEQGKAFVRIIANIQTAELATKSDLAELRTELIETRETLRSEIADVRNTLRSEIAEIRNTMATKDEMSILKEEISAFKLDMTTKIASFAYQLNSLDGRHLLRNRGSCCRYYEIN